MDRRSFLTRAAAIGAAAALPFQRVVERASALPLLAPPAGSVIRTFSQGPQAGYVGWVENELGRNIGWLTTSGALHTYEELYERGVLSR